VCLTGKVLKLEAEATLQTLAKSKLWKEKVGLSKNWAPHQDYNENPRKSPNFGQT
jgi:hypothetical protein